MVLFFIVFGISIRAIALRQMRGNNIWKITKPSKIVMNGIYKYVRHPMYTGALFLYFGLAFLATHNYGLTAILLSFQFCFFLDKIDREENLLTVVYGDVYQSYIKRTKLLIPFIL